MVIRAVRDGDLFSEHAAAVTHGPRTIEIREIRVFAHYRDALATCEFEIRSGRYSSVELQSQRGSVRSTTMILTSDDRKITAIHDGRPVQEIVHPGSGQILFDGPNPLFDWANAVLMLGIIDGEEIAATVYVIDPRTGSIAPSEYRFRRTGSLITVRKGTDPIFDSQIRMPGEGFGIMEHRSSGLRYYFKGGAGDGEE